MADYYKKIYDFGDGYHTIYKDNLQWIVNKAYGNNYKRALGFCRTRVGIERICRENNLTMPQDWPEHFNKPKGMNT